MGMDKPREVREGFLEEEMLMLKLQESPGLHQVQREGWRSFKKVKGQKGGSSLRKLLGALPFGRSNRRSAEAVRDCLWSQLVPSPGVGALSCRVES